MKPVTSRGAAAAAAVERVADSSRLVRYRSKSCRLADYGRVELEIEELGCPAADSVSMTVRL